MQTTGPRAFTFVPYSIYYTDPKYNQTRRSTVINFGTDLMKIPEFNQLSQEEIILLLQKLERGCYHAAISRAKKMHIAPKWNEDAFHAIYGERTYNLIQNLKPDSSVGNREFLLKVLSGEIDPLHAADLDPQKISPELYEKMAESEHEVINLDIKPKANSLYTCKNCGTSGVSKENCYNRSFDESVTHRLTCLNCGHCWNE